MLRNLSWVLLWLAAQTAVCAAAPPEFSLYDAAKAGDVQAVERLLADGAEPNLREKFDAPLHAAASIGRVDIVRCLIDAGAEIDLHGFLGSPLLVAAAGGHLPVVLLLIEYGADVNAANAYGSTPLHFAAENGHLAVASALIAAGANVDTQQASGLTPILVATNGRHFDVIRLLLAERPNLEAVDCGLTVLHHAVVLGDRSLVKDFLAAGADPTMRSPDGETPLTRAQKLHDPELLRLLQGGAPQ